MATIAFAIITVIVVFLVLYGKGEPMELSAGQYNFSITKVGSRWPSSSYKFITEAPHPRTGRYDFMKLSIWWPASFCNSNKLKDEHQRCHVPIPNRFLLHDFRPMYGLYNTSAKEFYDDSVVPAYRTQPGCSVTPPAAAQAFHRQDLASIWNKMTDYWPSLVYGIDKISNWKYMWEEHGMCAEDPNADGSLRYFKTAIDFIEKYNFLTILQQKASVAPDDTSYHSLHVISDTIREKVGYQPQLRCSYRGLGESRVVQFIEIIFCFYREGNVIMNCQKKFNECQRFIVKFPTTPIT